MRLSRSDPIVERQLEVYRENFLRHGDTARGTYHNDQATQYLRFERLIQPLAPFAAEAFSIHDVGAGSAELHNYLSRRGIAHRYSGTEIVPEMVAAARAKFPDITMHCRSVADASVEERYDFVVLCGTFNQPGDVPRDEWSAFVFETLRKMFAMSRYAISFNFLTSYHTYSIERLCYLDPFEVGDFCIRELSRFTCVDHALPLFEANIAVFTQECMKRAYPDPALAKYLP